MVIPSGVAFFIKTGTIFTSKKWGKTALYNEETSKDNPMLYFQIAVAALVLYIVIGAFVVSKNMEKKVKVHKANLLKGGVMPRADKITHRRALEEIYEETPNIKLPHSKTF